MTTFKTIATAETVGQGARVGEHLAIRTRLGTPDALVNALQADEIRRLTESLMISLEEDPSRPEDRQLAPVACPGATYAWRRSAPQTF
jgi:hypothetical protein